MEQTNEKKSYLFCGISWCIIALGLMLYGILCFYGIQLTRIVQMFPPCIWNKLTGTYCPGCGGTRAVVSLFTGHPIRSFWYHPLVPYSVGIFGWYLLSNTIEWISRGKWKIGCSVHNWFWIVALILVFVNWIGKNILILCFHISM